jgi:hypothetical protein
VLASLQLLSLNVAPQHWIFDERAATSKNTAVPTNGKLGSHQFRV